MAIFTFITSWNDYFMQLIMLNSTSKLTISLGIAKLQAENSTDFGLIMAGASLAAYTRIGTTFPAITESGSPAWAAPSQETFQ